MSAIEKSEAIRAGLRKGFQTGTSKMALRKCYGYDVGADGELVVNPDEATIVRWIFESYLNGESLGKIAAGLKERGIPSPTGKPKWNRETLNKLLSNEKYTGQVLLQKTVSAGGSQFKNDGFMARCLIADTHEAIIADEIFEAVQREKIERTNSPESKLSTQRLF